MEKDTRTVAKRISPAAIHALKEALSTVNGCQPIVVVGTPDDSPWAYRRAREAS